MKFIAVFPIAKTVFLGRNNYIFITELYTFWKGLMKNNNFLISLSISLAPINRYPNQVTYFCPLGNGYNCSYPNLQNS